MLKNSCRHFYIKISRHRWDRATFKNHLALINVSAASPTHDDFRFIRAFLLQIYGSDVLATISAKSDQSMHSMIKGRVRLAI